MRWRPAVGARWGGGSLCWSGPGGWGGWDRGGPGLWVGVGGGGGSLVWSAPVVGWGWHGACRGLGVRLVRRGLFCPGRLARRRVGVRRRSRVLSVVRARVACLPCPRGGVGWVLVAVWL